MGQNESKAAGMPSRRTERGRGRNPANSKLVSSKRRALARTFSRRKGAKHVRTQLELECQRGLSADIPCAGAIHESSNSSTPALPSASNYVWTRSFDSSNLAVQATAQNYGKHPNHHFSDVPVQHLGVSESAARHPHSSKHSSKVTPLDCPSLRHRSSSTAAPAAPCGTSKKLSKKLSKTSTTRSKSRAPQNQRKCAEAHKSTLSRSSRKNKFGFGRQKVDKSSATTESQPATPLVALRSPPPLPPKPQRVQRTRTEPPPQHHRQPTPLAAPILVPLQQHLPPTPAALQQQPRSYSYFPQNSQNPQNFPKTPHTHYPSQGHEQYPNFYPPQAVTHTQVPAHHAHLYEQTPNSKVVHHKLTAVEEQICFSATRVHSGNFHHDQPPPPASAAFAHDTQRRPSTAHCRTRAPAVVFPQQGQHLQVPSLVYTQSGAFPLQHHRQAARRLSQATHTTSNSSSSTGYSCAKRPSFFAPTYPGDAHKLSAGVVPPHSQIYPSHSHKPSVAQVSHATHIAFPQDHALTTHSRTPAAVYPPLTAQQTAYSALTPCNEAGATLSQAQVQGMGNLIGTSCSARSRAVSRAAHDPTEEDYFREWLIGPAIGSGGYSEVFRVHNRRDATLTKAAKRVEFQREADYEEFMHEAAIIKELGSHKHVLAIQGLIKGPRHGWMIFELMEGDAYDMFTKNEANRILGLRKERMVANAVRQLLKGLIYCHEVGIVHFDIKPQNLLYKRVQSNRPDGTADQGAAGQPTYEWKLCDFNLARHRHNHPDGFYSQVYTLGYRAPEVIIAEHTKGRERYAERAERYGVGATTFQMLTEFCAFESFLSPQTEDTDKDFIRCVLMKNLIECLDSHELLTLEARDFILRMMMFRPDDRLPLEEALEHPFVSRVHEIPQEPPQISHSLHPSSSSSSSLRTHTSTQSPQENRNNLNTIPHSQAMPRSTRQAQQNAQTPGRAPPSAPIGDSQRRQKTGAAALAPEINLKQRYHKSKLRYLKEYHTRKLNL